MSLLPRLQFLAVGVHPPNVSNIPSGKAFHGKGTVQIWRMEEAPPAAKAAASRKGKQKVQEGPSPKHRVPGKVKLRSLDSLHEDFWTEAGCRRRKRESPSQFDYFLTLRVPSKEDW